MVTVAWRHFFPWLQNLPPEVKYVIDQTTCINQIYLYLAPLSRPRPALAQFIKKMQTKYIKRFLNKIHISHTQRKAFGIPFPLSQFSNIISFGVFEPVLFRSNSPNSGLPITIPYMDIVHLVNIMLSQNAFHERCQKLCANIVSQCGFGWHNQQTDITPLFSIFGQSFFSKSILPHLDYTHHKKRADK